MGVSPATHAPATQQYQVNKSKGSGMKETRRQPQQVMSHNNVLHGFGLSDSSSGTFITKA
jgi:hypothetical protein